MTLEEQGSSGTEPDGVPFRLRIGVTGHRDLQVDGALTAAIDNAITRIVRAVPCSDATPCRIAVVSSLSEGADRLIVQRALALPDVSLEVPLPLPVDEYERDFADASSRDEFRSLLSRADTCRVASSTLERPLAYEEAGRSIVDGCDVLLAIWDGKQGRGPGGTKDTVDMAHDAGMWVVIVQSSPPHAVGELNPPAHWPLVEDIERFNAALAAERGRPGPQGSTLGRHGSVEVDAGMRPWVEGIEAWLTPYFEPVDRLAQRARHALLWMSRTMAALAVASVAIVAIQTTYELNHRLALLEVLCMCLVFAFWSWLRRKDLHAQWVSMRFLTERLRSAAFLALVGVDIFPGNWAVGIHAAGRQEWIGRAFREIWLRRPRINAPPSAALPLARFLEDRWIDPQLTYYRSRGRHHATVHRIQLWTTGVLFGCTIIAAAIHALVSEGATSRALIVVAIVFPALGGALSWVDVLEEHRALADQYRHVAEHLAAHAASAERTADLESLRRLAAATDRELRIENAGWIDVMRYRDVDLLL